MNTVPLIGDVGTWTTLHSGTQLEIFTENVSNFGLKHRLLNNPGILEFQIKPLWSFGYSFLLITFKYNQRMILRHVYDFEIRVCF